MQILGIPILSLLIFFPMVGVGVLLLIKKENEGTLRNVALVVSIIEFLFSLPLFFAFDPKTAAMQFLEARVWVETYGISYKLGIDADGDLKVVKQ